MGHGATFATKLSWKSSNSGTILNPGVIMSPVIPEGCEGPHLHIRVLVLPFIPQEGSKGCRYKSRFPSALRRLRTPWLRLPRQTNPTRSGRSPSLPSRTTPPSLHHPLNLEGTKDPTYSWKSHQHPKNPSRWCRQPNLGGAHRPAQRDIVCTVFTFIEAIIGPLNLIVARDDYTHTHSNGFRYYLIQC